MCNQIEETLKKQPLQDSDFEKETTYKVDGCSFVVKPVFKDKSTETLGTILLRLMTCDE